MPRNPTKSPIVIESESPVLNDPFAVEIPEVSQEEREEAEASRSKTYLVVKGGKYSSPLGVLVMPEGKELDDRYYDIEGLVSQGIEVRLMG
jgi:hypothetical protein